MEMIPAKQVQEDFAALSNALSEILDALNASGRNLDEAVRSNPAAFQQVRDFIAKYPPIPRTKQQDKPALTN